MTESNTENTTEVQQTTCCGCLKVTCNGFCDFDAVVVRKELPVPEDAKSNVVYWMNNVAYILSEDKTKLVPLTGEKYVLPAATTSTLGGVIVGNGLNVAEDGTTSLQAASATKLGGVKVGSGLTSKADGTIATTFTQTDAEVMQVGSAFGVPNAAGLIEHISVVMSSQSDILPSIDYIGVFKVTPSTIDDSALTELQTMISGIETKPSEDGKNNIYNFILESPFDASTGEYVIQFYIKKQGQRLYHNLEVITPKAAATNDTPIFDLLTIKYDLDTKYAYIDFTLPGNDYSVVTEYRRNSGASTDAWTPIDNETTIDTSTNPNIIRANVDLNILYRNSDIRQEYLVRFTVSTNFGATIHLRQPVLTFNKTLESVIVPPIGSIIINSKSTFNPESIYLNTKWQRIVGRTIIAVDENDTDFSTAGKTGGEKAHVLNVSADKTKNEVGFIKTRLDTTGTYGLDSSSPAYNGRVAISLEGQNEAATVNAHNNLPPYITEYIWERIS